MPSTITRTCPRCQAEKPPAGFRDPGDVQTGRPPKVCASCRAQDARLIARQAANVAFRPENVRLHRENYAARSAVEVAAARSALHPDGRKHCPDGSGCGQLLPLSAFGEDRYQAAGLSSRCFTCQAAASVTA